MLNIDVYSSRAVIRSQEPLTVGMVGVQAHFRFSDLWKSLTKTVVFRQGDITKDIVGVTSVAVIPWEVLQEPGLPVQIGIYGSKEDGKVVIPTVWVETDPVFEGVDPMADTSTNPTLPVYQQLQEQIDSKSLLVVTVTGNDEDGYTSSHSLSEIRSAHEAGRPIVARYSDYELQLAEINPSLVHFEGSSTGLETVRFTVTKETTHVIKWQMASKQDVEACVGRLDEHAGSIDALNTQTQALGERLSGAVRRSDVQILQFTGLEEPAVYDPVGDSADPITVDLSKISDLIEHGQTLESHSESLDKLNTDVDDLEDVTDRNGQDIVKLTDRVNTQSQRVDELYGFSQTNTEDLRDLDTRLGEVEEALENVGQGGTGGGSGVHIGTEPPVDETVSLWVNPEGDAAWSDAAYYDETITLEAATNSQTLHFPCPIADFYELHIHMTGDNSVSKLYMEAGGISTYLIDPLNGSSSGTHIHLMATHVRNTMYKDVQTATYSKNAQPSVPNGIASIGNEAASLRLYSKDGGDDLLAGMEIRVWGVYKTQAWGVLKMKDPTGGWESIKCLTGGKGEKGDKGDPGIMAVASPTTLGGVKPVAKTEEMTNPVGVDELGGLWCSDGGNQWKMIDTIDLASGAVRYIIDTKDCNQIVVVSATELQATGGKATWKGIAPLYSSNTSGAVFNATYLGNDVMFVQRPRSTGDNLQLASCVMDAVEDNHTLQIDFDTVTSGTIVIFGR